VRAANFQATAAPRINTARPASAAAPANASITGAAATTSSSKSGCCCAACAGLECLDRTRFFSGQLLTDADLNNEQTYWLAKSRLHNHYLHGTGIVCGLQVTCSDCDGWVNIHPGYAIDPCGNDIIVCAGQSFNVLQAINACCQPKPTSDCSPLRYRPAASCQDAIQTWCITIEYKDQPSRMVTPLQQSTSQSSDCGCNGSGSSGGCGCGCGGKTQSSASCSCATAAASVSTSASCEATRIIEGYQLGVCQSATDTVNQSGYGTVNSNTQKTNATASPFEQCQATYKALMMQKPILLNANGEYLSVQQAYQAACQYLASAKAVLGSANTTGCQLETTLDGISIVAPDPSLDPKAYDGVLQTQLDTIAKAAFTALIDCFCYAFLPTCPAAGCDNRLILACVTVQNGKITDICHFGGGRKQLVTFPALGYWGSLIGLDSLLSKLGNSLEMICCGDSEALGMLLAGASSQGEVLTSSQGTPAAFNNAMFSMLSQRLGADAINTASPAASAVDLRPLVGMDIKSATGTLGAYGIPEDALTVTDVSSDPSWTDAAVAAGATYSPAAYRLGDGTTPRDLLTMYTKGNAVVGFVITSPTDVLKTQVAQLMAAVSALQTQLNNTQINVVNTNPSGDTATRSPAQKLPKK
jgi:hypothetical protein